MVARLEQLQTGRQQPMKKFVKHFAELKSVTYKRLTTTVEEEKSKEDFLQDIQQKEQKVRDLRLISEQQDNHGFEERSAATVGTAGKARQGGGPGEREHQQAQR